jgi:hypothetical protein
MSLNQIIEHVENLKALKYFDSYIEERFYLEDLLIKNDFMQV